MISPQAVMGIAQGVVGIGQSIFGASKLKKAKQAADAAIAGMETKEVDPLVSARLNAPMPGETEAEQAIGQSQTAALGSAKTKKSGLAAVSGIVAQSNKAKQGLAVQKGQYKIGAEKALVGERNAALQSRQQKQQLQTSIALQDVGAARQEVSQGIAGIGSAFGNLAGSGIFKKKQTTDPGSIA